MNTLIVNYHKLHAQFLQRGLRYENIGADLYEPESIANAWIGQYDVAIISVRNWLHPSPEEFKTLIEKLKPLHVLITAKNTPPKKMIDILKETRHSHFISSQENFKNLIRTLKTIHKSSQPKAEEMIQIGELRINTKSREVKLKGKKIELRNREFSLLECLAKHPGSALTRTFLLENAWDRNSNVLSNTVDVHISRLRQKINRKISYEMIVTIPCVGYKINPRKTTLQEIKNVIV